MDIIQAINDDRFFRPLFKDLETWRLWLIYLKALFGLTMTMEEGRFFKSCTDLEFFPKKPFRESYVIAGRRSGKSFISSIIAVYLATFQDWRKVLSLGERGWIFIIANDKNQARIIKQYVSGILESSAHFKKLISKDLTWEIELRNGVNIAVKTASFRTLRGYTLLAAILEEIAFWRSEESANPDKEILAAVRPALATIKDSLLLGISTPYSRKGVLYEVFKKHYGQLGGPLIWRAESKKMNPTLDKSMIQKDLADDPQAAGSEWLAQWRADIEAFLPPEVVEAAVSPKVFEIPRLRGVKYIGFVDPSGGRQDSFTLGIAHKGKSGKIILDVLKESRPPFQPEKVVKEFSEVLKEYKIESIESDRYAGEWVIDAFKRNGIRIKPAKKSKSEIYLEFLPLIMNGRVELLDNKRLSAQFSSLERRTRSGGKDAVDNFFGHDDLANAAAGACVLAERSARRPTVRLRRITELDKEESFTDKYPKGYWERL